MHCDYCPQSLLDRVRATHTVTFYHVYRGHETVRTRNVCQFHLDESIRRNYHVKSVTPIIQNWDTPIATRWGEG